MKVGEKKAGSPPKMGRWLLKRIYNEELFDEILGDLTELYEDRLARSGRLYASACYLKDCVLSLRNIGLRKQKKVETNYFNAMLIKYYFKIAFRNIGKDRTLATINILGLAVGLSFFLALLLFVKFELSFDKGDSWIAKNEQLYRIYLRSNINGESNINSKTAGMMGPVVKENFPEVLSYTRIGYEGGRVFRYNNQAHRTFSIYTADSTFFDIFPVKFIEGDPRTALAGPNLLVLTQTAAKKIFGDEQAVGKTLNTDKDRTFMVTAVIEDFPKNAHFSCDYLESMATYQVNPSWIDLWYTTYIALEEGTDPLAFEEKMQQVARDYVGPHVLQAIGASWDQLLESGSEYAFALQPFQSIYLKSSREYGIDRNTEWNSVRNGDITYVHIFSVVAFFILFIAVVNFMNLATAKSERRMKEVGVRKTFGSTRRQLVAQFICEAVTMSGIAVVLAVVLLKLLLPEFNALIDRQLAFSLLDNGYAISGLLALTMLVGLLAGSYPAFYLSGARPVTVLKNVRVKGFKSSKLRSSLVIAQFAISISLLIGTIMIKAQVDYLQNKNLGFQKDHLVSIRNAALLGTDIEAFQQELLKDSKIQGLTNSSHMFTSGIPGNGYLYNKETGADVVLTQFIYVDHHFLETFQIELKSGRFFSREFPDDVHGVIINEAAAKAFTSSDPVGNEITSIDARERGEKFRILGVVSDFNYESLHRQVRPLVLYLRPPRESQGMLTLRLSADDMLSSMAYIEETWAEFAPGGEPLNYRFVDETLDRLYSAEQKIGVIATIFAVVAIFIACLGLFGLAAFVTERRTKEIGIRKVLGANVTEIIFILSKEFTKWVLIANFIAWPVSYFVLDNWLQNFAFRVSVNWLIFVLAGAMAILITFLTIGLHVVKTARANPIRALRYE